ncbi:hypothetical protein GJAV_G00132510 [Gymnothorax javanicus]|nr:hypothetical protein GJAV_G00132510 [Gymnothorax javanicus]
MEAGRLMCQTGFQRLSPAAARLTPGALVSRDIVRALPRPSPLVCKHHRACVAISCHQTSSAPDAGPAPSSAGKFDAAFLCMSDCVAVLTGRTRPLGSTEHYNAKEPHKHLSDNCTCWELEKPEAYKRSETEACWAQDAEKREIPELNEWVDWQITAGSEVTSTLELGPEKLDTMK